MRNSSPSGKNQERIVLDFTSPEVPALYSFLSDSENILYVDFFNTQLKDKISGLANSPFVDRIEFHVWRDGLLTMEMKLKGRVFCEPFYLSTPSRLVFDLRKGP
jgi:hypothetical protein